MSAEARREAAKAHAAEQALGRSRGGYTTKVHMVCDGNGRPLFFALTPGNIHDSTAFDELLLWVLAYARVFLRPSRLEVVVCDKGYDCRRIVELCERHGLRAVIPKRKTPKGEERTEADFDKESYRQRNVVERCLGWLKENRRIAMRYEKLAATYSGMLELAMLRRLLRAA